MAIVTGDLYKGFTFGDVSSKDYGVYITQEAAYNAPERDTEVVEIAGRNGAYILDKGRFKNITISYKCGIALDDEQSFESAIRTFRNALASKAGKYVLLEDEYNLNEYRQAAFLGGIEVEMADRRAGEFTVSFDAMPQRFLKSGETSVSVASGGTITNPTLFESHPLLQVWGYGEMTINDKELEIASVTVGLIQVSNSMSSQLSGKTCSFNIDLSALNTGDNIRIDKAKIGAYITGTTIDNQYGSIIEATTNSSHWKVNSVAWGNVYGRQCAYCETVTDIYNDPFVKGTSGTRSAQIRLTVGSAPCTYAVTLQYDGNETFRLYYGTFSPSTIDGSMIVAASGDVFGNSSKSALGEPLYFDLDIGEAYKIEDGQTVSVNNAVTIPAKLPTLKSGENIITYDNTITQFNVVPRWWEV